jgi:hypothetical protein
MPSWHKVPPVEPEFPAAGDFVHTFTPFRKETAMPLDPVILGNLAAGQMAALEEHFGDEDVQIGTAVTIVEIVRVHARNEQGEPTMAESLIRTRFNVGDPFRVVGILDQAKFNLLAGPGVGPPEE